MVACDTDIGKSASLEVQKTFDEVREASFQEKREVATSQEVIDGFLDKILELKKGLQEKSAKISEINERLEALTWFDEVDEETLMKINEIISLCKDFRSSLIRYFVKLNFLRKKGIAKEEIKALRNAIADLKEITQDLESRFFFLPQMPVFKETSKQLSLL
jgi:DNA repair exonuclease SbcCD ATPase subunit